MLEAALVASVDHSRKPRLRQDGSNLCLGLNGAMGTAVHMLDDVHGGAGQQFVSMLQDLAITKWDKSALLNITNYRLE